MVSIIIPVYNESKVIGELISEIKSELIEIDTEYEIIVVDDGSDDNSKFVAESAGAKVISHAYNIGNGAAVKTGIRNAVGQTIVLMDGDGQHKPKDINRLLEFIPQYDMVVGARIDNKTGSIHRNLANWIYNKFSSYISNFKIYDLTSGFRAIKREILSELLYLLPNTFSYPTTITMSVIKSGFSVKYVPIQVKKRVGKSKIKLINDGFRFLLIIFKIGTLFSPLRIFIPFSTLFFTAGFSHFIYKVFYLGGKYTSFTILLFIIAIMIFLLGLISEQISQMRYDRSS